MASLEWLNTLHLKTGRMLETSYFFIQISTAELTRAW